MMSCFIYIPHDGVWPIRESKWCSLTYLDVPFPELSQALMFYVDLQILQMKLIIACENKKNSRKHQTFLYNSEIS